MSSRHVSTGVAPRTRAMRTVALGILVAAMVATLAPASAFAANAYGQTFAGEQGCLECHNNVEGRWQVGTYSGTSHDLFVQDVSTNTASLEPTTGSNRWPSPAYPGGLTFGTPDLLWQIGHPGQLHEYVSKYKNDASYTLSTGSTLNTITAPADDWRYFDIGFSPSLNMWELGDPPASGAYFQSCGGCHFLAVTRPSDVTYTLPTSTGATQSRSTETSFSGVGIQCENCHGTGQAASADEDHWTSGVKVVRTNRVLDSQTCGQCHATMTAKQKRFVGGTSYFSNPNGFTTDNTITAFVDVYGAGLVQTSPLAPAPVIPGNDKRYYPSGHNKGGNHFYYNEWMLSKHARSLRWQDGSTWSSSARDSCLGCHSGEGYLQKLGYGANGANDIGLTPAKVASVTADVECSVCHTVHARTGEALGLRLPAEELCVSCHSGRLPEGVDTTPGVRPRYNSHEMFEGFGMIGVPVAGRSMADAGCVGCHMTYTASRGDRISHRFTPMLPGDAEEWGVREGGDACTGCHPTSSRADMQADIDEWQSDIRARLDEATAALLAAKSRPSSTTAAGKTLIDSAQTNVWFLQGEGSYGVHNYPYAKAGADKTIEFARAVGANFSSFGVTGYDTLNGRSLVAGRLTMGDGGVGAGKSIVIEAKPGGALDWTAAATVVTDANGDFAAIVYPTGTTEYRARWTPGPAATSQYSALAKVTFTSRTTIKASASRIPRYGYVTLSGTVSPAHAGQNVTVYFKIGSGSYRTLSVRNLTSTSTWSVRPKLSTRAYYYFYARFQGDPSHAASTSSSVRVQVY